MAYFQTSEVATRFFIRIRELGYANSTMRLHKGGYKVTYGQKIPLLAPHY